MVIVCFCESHKTMTETRTKASIKLIKKRHVIIGNYAAMILAPPQKCTVSLTSLTSLKAIL